jgi:hypothetical protein
MAKPVKPIAGAGGEDRTVLTEEHIRIIVDQCIQPHVTTLTQTIDRFSEARSSETMLERVLDGFGELTSIRNLLPLPKELDPLQKARLARIRAEGMRLPDPNPMTDEPDEDLPDRTDRTKRTSL